MLAGVKQIDNLDGVGKMQTGEVPDPLGSIAHDHLLDSAVQSAMVGLGIETLTELGGGLDGSRVGSRVRVTEGVAFPIPGGLRENASQFDFPCVGRLSFHLALSRSAWVAGIPVP